MSKNAGDPPTSYDVGRGKPPRHTRFQKGRSGNPGGRKKERLNNRTLLEGVLHSEIVVSDRGKPRKTIIWEALMLRCAQSALTGDQRAIEFMLKMGKELDDAMEDKGVELEQDDQAILDAMLARRRSDDQGLSVDPEDLGEPMGRPVPKRPRSHRRSER